ncbi:MAG: hypothetical protein K8S87_01035 [Planctomycetes bacterium]|nr:hypothetical protein [Planctomycetota bacterium]
MSDISRISDNQWRSLLREFTKYFDEMKSFEMHQIREDMFDFHYSLLSDNENEYKTLYKNLIFNRNYIRFSDRVHVLELMSMKIYRHKRLIDSKLRQRNLLLTDDKSDVSILVNSLIELMNDMTNRYVYREDLTNIQNNVNKLIFLNRKQLKLSVESIILFHSINRNWKLISRFIATTPHNADNKKVYYLAMIHRAFLKSLDDSFHSILDVFIEFLNKTLAKQKKDLERDDELNILFTLLTAYLKHPHEIRFFLKNRQLDEEFIRTVRKDIMSFVFEPADYDLGIPPFFDTDDFD